MRPISLAVATALCLSAFASAQGSIDTLNTSAGPVQMIPIMHASVLLRAAGKVIYIDPAQGKYDGLPAADLILITDIHGDHMAPDVIRKVSKNGTVVWGPPAVADKTHVDTTIANGETKKWENWTIEAIPAYNLKRGPGPGQLYHDKGRGNGYVLNYGGKRFYFSGDTEAVPEMLALKNIDVAFVCMNLPYTMPPDEAAAAVKAIRPVAVFPYHYRGSDLAAFANPMPAAGINVRLREWYPKD